LPGLRSLFTPTSPFGFLIPTCFWNPGLGWQWDWRNREVYSKYGLQTISALGFLQGAPAIYTISLDVAKEFVALKWQITKDIETRAVLARYPVQIYGKNLFTESGSEWSRHRRIMNPAFNPETYALVWDEAAIVYQEMMKVEEWMDQNDIMISAINRITSRFALIIIGRCGFGEPMSWTTVAAAPESGMSFGEALSIVSATSLARLVIPRWMYSLPIRRLREIETAFTSLDAHMKALIATRRQELKEKEQNGSERKDVFQLMLRANEGQGALSMTDDEIVGDVLETTARTLDATIGFLALHEEIQEEVYNEIRDVVETCAGVYG
ncbi:cytochrome P450, partial [Mycena galopus ATCC 62051]